MKTQQINIEFLTFRDECKVINLKKEYPGYAGTAKWILASSLSEEELLIKYPDEITMYSPYVYMTSEMYEPIAENQNNVRKYKLRGSLWEDAFDYQDERSERHHSDLIHDPCDTILAHILVRDALKQLNPVQFHRIYKRYYEKMKLSDLASEEGCSIAAVDKSIKNALEKMRKYIMKE